MTGPNEQRLSKALSARPGDIERAEVSWTSAADGLNDVSRALATARERVAAAWTGAGADSATEAFTKLGASVDQHELDMRRVAESLSTAGAALKDAQQAYHDLPTPPPEPTAPEPGAGGEVRPEDEVRYLKLQGQRSAVVNARETQAGVAYDQLRQQLEVADRSMTNAAPEGTGRWSSGGSAGGATTGGGAGGGTAGTTSGGYRAPGTTRAHIGPYATADTGTHVGIGHVGAEAPAAAHGLSHADGVVGGVLPVATGGHVPAGPVLGGAPGGLAAHAVGGAAAAAGVVAGVGGALGIAAGARGIGGLGGALAGPGVLGARAPLGAAAGVLGGSRGGGGSAPGGVEASGAGVGGRGTATLRGGTALSEGETVPARGGVLGGRGSVVGTSGTGGSSTGATGASGGAGGAGGAGGRAGGRFGTGATVGEGEGTGTVTGAGRGTARGAAGGRGRGGLRGGTGRHDEEREGERGHLVFEDDAWLDDEAGPGVIR